MLAADRIVNPQATRPSYNKDGTAKSLKFDSFKDKQAFLTWLGKLNQRRQWLRIVSPPKHIKKCEYLIGRICHAVCPWTIEQYPGKPPIIGEVLGIKAGTAAYWINGSRPISWRAARRGSEWLRAKAAEYLALAEELDAIPERQHGIVKDDPRLPVWRDRRARRKDLERDKARFERAGEGQESEALATPENGSE